MKSPDNNPKNDVLREIELEVERELSGEIEKELGGKGGGELEDKLKEKIRAELSEEIRTRVSRMKRELEIGLAKKDEKEKPKEREFSRFGLAFRVQHWLLLGSCLILIATGIPLKFHDEAWANFVFKMMGGIKTSGLIHRVGAAGLGIVAFFHVLYLFFWKEGKRDFRELLPRPKDVLDLIHMVKYYLGFSKTRARFGRFSYVEKFDYWAVYWGMVIMLGSGSILWFHNYTLRVLPKFVADIAREAHSDEGLLATLAIIIWHFYNVHLNPECFPMNRAWLDGRITESKMIHHHPVEYEKMIAEESAKEPGEEKVD